MAATDPFGDRYKAAKRLKSLKARMLLDQRGQTPEVILKTTDKDEEEESEAKKVVAERLALDVPTKSIFDEGNEDELVKLSSLLLPNR